MPQNRKPERVIALRSTGEVVDLPDMLDSEGNGFIAQGLIKAAAEEFLPAIEVEKMTRYLYQTRP